MQGPRAQADRKLYRRHVRKAIDAGPGLNVFAEVVKGSSSSRMGAATWRHTHGEAYSGQIMPGPPCPRDPLESGISFYQGIFLLRPRLMNNICNHVRWNELLYKEVRSLQGAILVCHATLEAKGAVRPNLF